jgi:hypothetical protein
VFAVGGALASIFISYRRADSVAWARLLRDSFARDLPEVQIFRDIDAILPGDDFARIISDAVASCDVLIALVGPNWAAATNPATGKRRLLEENDFTRLEVGSALSRGVRVIPVLVGGASMPSRGDLPDDLKSLCDRQNVELSDRAWDDGCRGLADVLARVLSIGKAARSSPPNKVVEDEPVPRPPAPHAMAPPPAPMWTATRRVALGVGGAGAVAGITWFIASKGGSARTTTVPAPVAVQPPVAAAPAAMASSVPRPPPPPPPRVVPSLLDLDLAGDWKPFTPQTPEFLIRIARQEQALVLSAESLQGPSKDQVKVFGRIEVFDGDMTYANPDGSLKIWLRSRKDIIQSWTVEVTERETIRIKGFANVDSSGRVWRARLSLLEGTQPDIELHATVTQDGTKAIIQWAPLGQSSSSKEAREFVYVRPK